MDFKSVEGKVAIVTGASRGIERQLPAAMQQMA